MNIFSRVGHWLTEKSDRFIRGEEEYDSYEEEQGAEPQQAAPDETPRQALDPFGNGDDEYGGRVPYRSHKDMEREAAEKQRREQQAAQAAQKQAAQQQAAYQQQMRQQQAPQMQQGYQQAYAQSNVVPFPGMQRGPDGAVYSHVEYVVLLRSRLECKDVIAHLKANASVFLNMVFIANDSERQRCVDMLSGAAYTLGCKLNKISPRGIYLISAPSVCVVLDQAIQKAASAPESQSFVRQRYEHESYGANPQQPMAQQPAPQPQPEPQTQRPVSGFSSGSFTSRFQAQGQQRSPTSFGSVMAGNATGMYQPVGNTGRYAAVQQ